MSRYDIAEDAIEAAKKRSLEHRCTTHVNAQVKLRTPYDDDDGLMFEEVTYELSDWYVSGSTVFSSHEDGRGGLVS